MICVEKAPEGIRLLVDGRQVFVGSEKELKTVLGNHQEYMKYIDAHDGDGRIDGRLD